MSGSVEAACGLGLADAVVDLVETGTTMVVRHLRKRESRILTCLYSDRYHTLFASATYKL